MKRLFATFVAILAATLSFAQTEIRVQVHNVVAEDEQFNVTFIIEGEAKSSDFSWSPGDDFQLLWGPQQGRSTSVQIVNGKTTRSVQTTYSYVLRPVKAGKFTLPRAVAKVKGQEIYSDPVSVEVAASGSSSSSSSSAQADSKDRTSSISSGVSDEDMFLKISLSRSNVVVGEPLIATIKLYQRVDVAGFESAVFPTFNGFWSQELDSPTNIEFVRETYDGQIYNSALLRRYILIPQRQGELKIDPAELVCLVNIRVPSRGASIFDGFFDDYRTVRKKIVSDPLTVKVSALPAGAPASFAGGVGEFGISAKVNKDSLKTHEAASLVITVSGKGNITLLEPPKVSFPPDMEVYDTKVSDMVDKGGLSGSKVYEFPFIPRSHGDFVIEPVKYSYYDINKKAYVTVETQAIPVSVARGNETEALVLSSGGVAQKDVRNLGSDIRFISTKAPGLSPKGDFLMGSVLFWIIIVLISAVAICAWVLLRRIAARRADVAGSRNRKATKMALKRLHLAGTFLKQNLYTAFYEELHKALLGFISDKLNIPAAELSHERMSEALMEGGVDDSIIKTFIGILDACEFARYAPSSGHDAMAAHYEDAVEVISSIDSEMKGKKTDVKGKALMITMLMLLPLAAQAQEAAYADSLWNSANYAYTQGQWNEAAKTYELISGMGLQSAPLYCNTGNAYFKGGEIAKAILFYERALKIDPSYADARFNLALANDRIQDRIDPVPEFVLKAWIRQVCYMMDSDSWAVCFILMFALSLAMLLVFILARTAGGRKTGFFVGILTLLLAVLTLIFSIWQKRDSIRTDDAIVMRPVTSVKSSPSSEASTDLFVLHEGTKVKIIDEVGVWNNIELADGRQGWIQSNDIEVI